MARRQDQGGRSLASRVGIDFRSWWVRGAVLEGLMRASLAVVLLCVASLATAGCSEEQNDDEMLGSDGDLGGGGADGSGPDPAPDPEPDPVPADGGPDPVPDPAPDPEPASGDAGPGVMDSAVEMAGEPTEGPSAMGSVIGQDGVTVQTGTVQLIGDDGVATPVDIEAGSFPIEPGETAQYTVLVPLPGQTLGDGYILYYAGLTREDPTLAHPAAQRVPKDFSGSIALPDALLSSGGGSVDRLYVTGAGLDLLRQVQVGASIETAPGRRSYSAQLDWIGPAPASGTPLIFLGLPGGYGATGDVAWYGHGAHPDLPGNADVTDLGIDLDGTIPGRDLDFVVQDSLIGLDAASISPWALDVPAADPADPSWRVQLMATGVPFEGLGALEVLVQPDGTLYDAQPPLLTVPETTRSLLYQWTLPASEPVFGGTGYARRGVFLVQGLDDLTDTQPLPAPASSLGWSSDPDLRSGLWGWQGSEGASAVVIHARSDGLPAVRLVLPGDTSEIDVNPIRAALLAAASGSGEDTSALNPCNLVVDLIAVYAPDYSPDVDADGSGGRLLDDSGLGLRLRNTDLLELHHYQVQNTGDCTLADIVPPGQDGGDIGGGDTTTDPLLTIDGLALGNNGVTQPGASVLVVGSGSEPLVTAEDGQFGLTVPEIPYDLAVYLPADPQGLTGEVVLQYSGLTRTDPTIAHPDADLRFSQFVDGILDDSNFVLSEGDDLLMGILGEPDITAADSVQIPTGSEGIAPFAGMLRWSSASPLDSQIFVIKAPIPAEGDGALPSADWGTLHYGLGLAESFVDAGVSNPDLSLGDTMPADTLDITIPAPLSNAVSFGFAEGGVIPWKMQLGGSEVTIGAVSDWRDMPGKMTDLVAQTQEPVYLGEGVSTRIGELPSDGGVPQDGGSQEPASVFPLSLGVPRSTTHLLYSFYGIEAIPAPPRIDTGGLETGGSGSGAEPQWLDVRVTNRMMARDAGSAIVAPQLRNDLAWVEAPTVTADSLQWSGSEGAAAIIVHIGHNSAGSDSEAGGGGPTRLRAVLPGDATSLDLSVYKQLAPTSDVEPCAFEVVAVYREDHSADRETDGTGGTLISARGPFALGQGARKMEGLELRRLLRNSLGCGEPQQAQDDYDQDGYPDSVDNCPGIANASQLDFDEDQIGDACDNCPNDSNPDQEDVCSQTEPVGLTVTGTLLGADGAAVSGGSVQLLGLAGQSTTTDAAGQFVFADLPEAPYDLLAFAPGGSGQSQGQWLQYTGLTTSAPVLSHPSLQVPAGPTVYGDVQNMETQVFCGDSDEGCEPSLLASSLYGLPPGHTLLTPLGQPTLSDGMGPFMGNLRLDPAVGSSADSMLVLTLPTNSNEPWAPLQYGQADLFVTAPVDLSSRLQARNLLIGVANQPMNGEHGIEVMPWSLDVASQRVHVGEVSETRSPVTTYGSLDTKGGTGTVGDFAMVVPEGISTVLYTYQHYPASPAGQSGYDTEVVSIVGAVGAASDNVTAPAPGGRVRLEDGVDPYTGVLSWTGTETATAVIVKVTDGGYSGAAPLRAVLPGNTQQLDLISFVQAAGLEAFCWGLIEVIGVFQAEYSPDMEVDGRGANLVPRSGYPADLGRGSFDLDQIELRRMVREADYYTCEYGE